MTQAFNLSQLANGVNTSGQVNAASYLYNQVPVANGGTALSSAGAAGNMLLATSASAYASVTMPTFGFRNRIINGAMMIDQRNAGASVTPTSSAYTLDRWQAGLSQASKYSVQQNAGSVTPPAGYTNYLGVTSLSAYSVLSTDNFFLQQPVEGLNCSDLGWGTANAQAVTLSFLVRSSLTGSFGGTLLNSANNYAYPFLYTISAANTWTPVSITITGPTAGTWLTTNGVGIRVNFGLGCGSSNSGTAGSWVASNVTTATGATSVVGTSGATFYITGVQLEKGSTATSFDYRPYGTELALCRRYLPAKSSQGGTNAPIGIAVAPNSTGLYLQWTFDVPARVAPTGVVVSSASHFTANAYGTGGGVASAVNFSSASNTDAAIQFVTTGLTAGQSGNIIANNASANIYLTGCEL